MKKYNHDGVVRKMALVALRATKISALHPASLVAGRAVMIKFVRVLPVVLALTSQAMAQAGSACEQQLAAGKRQMPRNLERRPSVSLAL
jgi:hypothetical protein